VGWGTPLDLAPAPGNYAPTSFMKMIFVKLLWGNTNELNDQTHKQITTKRVHNGHHSKTGWILDITLKMYKMDVTTKAVT